MHTRRYRATLARSPDRPVELRLYFEGATSNGGLLPRRLVSVLWNALVFTNL